MSPIISGFEYDIFISYRHNDNRSGWVTEFVKTLKEELAATIKEPVSVYFDTNPHDGLLETHNVDKSLEGKLKCLIFIPILSQTYCDSKSFAWQNEFCAFNKLAVKDDLGRDIKLNNGNVSSRILPIKIHELDTDDAATIETEIGGVLRAIEFIYKEPGVNRPLLPDDNRILNLEKTDYRNQINKVANAIKEIINAITNQVKPSLERIVSGVSQPRRNTKRNLTAASIAILIISIVVYFSYPKLFSYQKKKESSKTIAVLAFTDMSPEKDQEYLGDGIAEEIINLLTKIDGLKVIGRTSSFSFKGKNTDLKVIGETLGASTLLEGSVRKANNKIRITAQLINAEDGSHLWSQTFDRELTDIFSIQDEISQAIADKFKLTLAFFNEQKPPTKNLEAYEAYLKGKHAASRGLIGTEQAKDNLIQAIKLDPSFVSAYLELSKAYWSVGYYGQMDKDRAYALCQEAAIKAVELDPHSTFGYSQLSFNDLTIDWNFDQALNNYNKAVEANGGNPIFDANHSTYMALLYGGNEQSIKEVKQLLEIDPLSIEGLTQLSRMYLYNRQYDDVLQNGKRVLELSPENTSIIRHMASANYFSGHFNEALQLYGKLLESDSSYAPYGYVATLIKLDRSVAAKEVFNQLSKSMSPGKKAICYANFGDLDNAFLYLNKGCDEKDVFTLFIKAEPHFDIVRKDPRYLALLKKMNLPE